MTSENLDELIDRHLRGGLSNSEKEQLAEITDGDPSLRKQFVEDTAGDTQLSEAIRGTAAIPTVVQEMAAATGSSNARLAVAIAAAASIVSIASAYLNRVDAEPMIAKLTGVNGALQWTLDGRTIVRDLVISTALPSGTVEGVTPNTWVEPTFNDGSVVTVSGISLLTFSDNGQKTLHLKEGSFPGNIQPQPVGKPMLVHTPTATLKVMGTRFSVNTDAFSSILSVKERPVELERLSDGHKIEAPASYRVTAAPDREMELAQVPETVNEWVSHIERGPRGIHGQWSPTKNEQPAKIQSAPYTAEQRLVIYTAGLGVWSGESSPVVARTNSVVRIRGSMSSPHDVWIGGTVRQANGDFAGQFQLVRPAEEFGNNSDFEVALHIQDFKLDPLLRHMSSELPELPFDLVVESNWCQALYDQVGLAVTEVRLSDSAATSDNGRQVLQYTSES